LPFLPGGELFATLGQGITQLIYAHQTELKTKIKQGHRFPADYKLSSMIIPGSFEGVYRRPSTGRGNNPHGLIRLSKAICLWSSTMTVCLLAHDRAHSVKGGER
jgi:hypothetical protein